jgi:hypothetical protein
MSDPTRADTDEASARGAGRDNDPVEGRTDNLESRRREERLSADEEAEVARGRGYREDTDRMEG